MLDRIARLLDEGGYKEGALLEACRSGDIELVERQINHELYIDAMQSSCSKGLLIASQRDRLDIMALLLHYGPEIDVRDEEPYDHEYICPDLSSYQGNTGILKFLVSNNVGWTAYNRDGLVPFIAEYMETIAGADASGGGDKGRVHTTVRLFDKHCLDHESIPWPWIRDGDETWDTCLHIATERGDIEMIQLLLAHGASMTMFNVFGLTPFTIAYKANSREIIDMFLERGIDLNDLGYPNDKYPYYHRKRSPLMAVCAAGDLEMAKILLQHGANVDLMYQGEMGTVGLTSSPLL